MEEEEDVPEERDNGDSEADEDDADELQGPFTRPHRLFQKKKANWVPTNMFILFAMNQEDHG